MHRELKRKHVTLLIALGRIHRREPGAGYSYSRFCELCRSFEKTLSVTMRQTHAAGERLFVDYAGDGVPVVIDRLTGEIRSEPYEYSEWRVRRVGVDYHVDIDAHYYSVPYRFARAEVEAPADRLRRRDFP